MKLLSAQQIQQWDAFTMQAEAIASIDLMERAAIRCVDWMINENSIQSTVKIFCGKGNNGGDGLAIARLLIEKGFAVSVYILEFGARGTDDFQDNLQRLHQLTKNIHFIQSEEHLPAIEHPDLVVDALYGSGLNRPLKDLSALVVEHINQSSANIISIDVPSGMSIDKSSKGNSIIRARNTLTFQSLKLCFLITENANYFGITHVLDIGLHPQFLETIDTVFQITDLNFIKHILPERNAFVHKGKFGHAFLIAGNAGKIGAAIMAAGAALRTGCGLLSVNIPKEYASVVHAVYPEAMIAFREHGLLQLETYSSIGIGPGLGTNAASEQLLEQVLNDYQQPFVIDADAITILSFHKEWLKKIRPGSVLTPHPKEFDRLFGNSDNEFERIEKAIYLTKEYPFIIVLKGHYTFIAFNGKGWFNTTGNAGLAKGGSGDVLTGMLTTLLAQTFSPFDAAVAAVYLHGLAADLALENQSMESLIATDVINAIGKAFNYLREVV
jgi:NAD(P)H-hydrate epimerase